MPANVNKNKLGTKNTTPGLRCQERIHQSNLFSGKEWYCAINLSYIEEWHSAIYLSFSKESYCTVLPIYLVSSRKPQRIVPGLQDLAGACACLLVCIPVLLRNFFDILVFLLNNNLELLLSQVLTWTLFLEVIERRCCIKRAHIFDSWLLAPTLPILTHLIFVIAEVWQKSIFLLIKSDCTRIRQLFDDC